MTGETAASFRMLTSLGPEDSLETAGTSMTKVFTNSYYVAVLLVQAPDIDMSLSSNNFKRHRYH